MLSSVVPGLYRNLDHAGVLHLGGVVRALSLYGYTTQRNLSAIGSFLVMGLIGLMIAMLVNLFSRAPGSTS